MQEQTGIQAAVAKFDGSPTRLAIATDGRVTRQNIEHWLKAGRVPAEKAPLIERASGVPVEALCPEADWNVIRGVPKRVGKTKRAHVGELAQVAA